jgi:iron(III) transport system ATP-binding protein
MPDSMRISDLWVRLGQADILKGIDLTVPHGKIIALLGRSGSGKSTLLRAIAGLEKPISGSIEIARETVFSGSRQIDVAPETRNLGLVFQSYALWPHKTVFENVAYGLKIRRIAKEEARRLVAETLESVGLSGLADRYPHQLSGGQQQRVALVRAIVYSPPVVLLDEPLSNLDAKLRDEARVWIRQLVKKKGLTAIFVTHDQVEAMAVADSVVLMNEGLVEQMGTPQELYEKPKTSFAAQFMGANLSWNGRVESVSGNRCSVRLDDRVLAATLISPGKQAGQDVDVHIRVRSVRIGEAGDENATRAALIDSSYVGGEWDNLFSEGGREWRVVTRERPAGGEAWLSAPVRDCWAF